MDKKNALQELEVLFKTIIEDRVVTPNEVNLMQDWIDSNAVLFVGEDYGKIIVPLQKFVEDGVLSINEIEEIYILIEQFA